LPTELSTFLPPYKCGIILSDPTDPKFQHVASFRRRVGETLHRAAYAMRDAGESDNSVETVKILVTIIGTYLTAYGIRAKQLTAASTAYTGMGSTKRMYDSQRKQHRHVFMAAASVHSQTRLSTLAYQRTRSDLDDKLIKNMLDFCLSPFVRVRRSAQASLETISKIYRGMWVLCFPLLFDALKQGSDPDRMKGALYVLRYNWVGISRISRDWRHLLPLTECLLNAHHENKASVQALVTKATDELIATIKEPISLHMEIDVDRVDAAAQGLTAVLKRNIDLTVVGKIRKGLNDLITVQDREYDTFIDRVLAISKNPALNWRYVLSAARFLYSMTRRDLPADTRLLQFFADHVQNPHPRIRDYGTM
jgi:proteasome activator subunit 4